MLVQRNNPDEPQSAVDKDIDPEQFCADLNCPDGAFLSFRVAHPNLFKTDSTGSLVREVKALRSIPLSEAFTTHTMTRKTQCILAYILAKSVWQYYGSDWMRWPWTTENIHILDDQPIQQGMNTSSYSCRPCFGPDFQDDEKGITDYYTGTSLFHHYPKALALGILLIEIAKGNPLEKSALDYTQGSIKSHIKSAWRVLKTEGVFGKGEDEVGLYHNAVRSCLRFGCNKRSEMSVCEQRAIIYQDVVCPLKELLEGTQRWLPRVGKMKRQLDPEPATPSPSSPRPTHNWKSEESTAIERIKLVPPPELGGRPSSFRSTNHATHSVPAGTSHEQTTTQICIDGGIDLLGERGPKSSLLGQTRTSSSEAWLKRFQKISGFVKSNAKGRRPIKIAVLDTGCDLDASVFKVPGFREEVISRWKDMVNGEAMPLDEDPGKHGTRIVSVLLRIAPIAEIFVARVASNPKMLRKSHETIADAIVHSARNWDVDVVSMSFGFENEITVIKNAIEEAHRIKNQSIVFLAAAGNDGYNSSELFPAYLDSVISIRGTDYTGNFVASLNPRQQPFNKGELAYGTLGKDVPYAWPDEDACKTISGCSIATPVAAAVVALILNCAIAEVFDDNDRKLLRTRRAILGVFKHISESQDGLCYLAPWELFSTSDEGYRVSILTIAIRKLPVIA